MIGLLNITDLTVPTLNLAAGGMLAFFLFCGTVATGEANSLPSLPGAAIYKEDCARCHGAAGQGAKKYPHPLLGDKSPAQLANLISKTMPDDDPETCTGADARNVAKYVYDSFYSPDAQARISPPKAVLSHLTVRQYRNAVADLLGSFRFNPKLDARQGLHAEYFNSRDLRNDRRVADRVDPQVRFELNADGSQNSDEGPKLSPEQFAIKWEGSVIAPETGIYDFVVRSDLIFRLWVNEPKPMIDASVKSGSDIEYRGSIFLIGGRAYSIKLEVFRFQKQKQKENKKKPAPAPTPTGATVQLLWRLPHRVDELIPARHLSPGKSAEVAVMQTPFPPDDRSYGWERGTAVSKEWVSATADAALEVAGYVSAHLPELAGATDNASDRDRKARNFCRTFAERAFRRPLSDAEKKVLVDSQFDAAKDLDLAVKRSIIRVMTSPGFLYAGAIGAKDGYGVAAKLALVLWDSLPDSVLLSAAAAGKLSTREQISAQAHRMLDDPRAKAKLHEFLLAWLRVDQAPDLVKDSKRFPSFDPAIASDLRTSLDLFLDDVASSDSSDFRQLLLSDQTYLNGRLASFYGADLPSDAGFTKVKWDPEHRAGVLTHPYMLSTLAYPAESSPIHRGVFIVRGLLGITLRPPQQAVTPAAPELHPGLTTRQRITLQTTPAFCSTCHATINPLGFPLENFDAVGRFRDRENGKAIDTTGHYETREGSIAQFAGPRDLATFLANSDQVDAAFAQQLFQHLVKQPVRAYGLDTPKVLDAKFAQSGYSIRKLTEEIAVIAAENNNN